MPGPVRNSFMRHWYAVEVRIYSLAGRRAADSPSCAKLKQGHPHVSTVVVHPLALPKLDVLLFFHSYVVVGAVVAGGTWYLTRLARGPSSMPPTTLPFVM